MNNAPTRFTDPSGHKCVGDEAECNFPLINYWDNVPLSSDAQDLITLSEQVGMTPSDIIKLGIAHEMFGWASDKDKVNKFAQYLSNRFVWYAKHNCGGMLTYNCYLNFAVATHQTIKKSFVENYLNNPADFEQNESLNWSQTYHDAAEIVMDGFWTRIDRNYDPDANWGDRDKPFNIGIVPMSQLDGVLNKLTPDQSNAYFIVKTSTTCGGIPSYSLIVSYTGDQLLQDNKVTLTSC